jgi:hypothetical protein
MSGPLPAPVHLHLIAYNQATWDQAEPGYARLDNRANPRPDWFEYWPVRAHLLQALQAGTLDEHAYYGFFSPKFGKKTALSHAQVVSFVQGAAAEGADVVLFSPQPDMGAFFLNVFEQGETFDAGLIEAFGAFLQHIGRPVDLRALVMDSRQIVFSNYFVARPAFWREWLHWNEQLYAVCEGPEGALKAALTVPTSYPGNVQRKVFLMERVASLLLTIQPRWRTKAHDPFGMGWSMTRMRDYPTEAVISDALKLAWRDQGFATYLHAFARVREHFGRQGLPLGKPPG